MHAPLSLMAACTSRLPAMSFGRGRAMKRAGGYAEGSLEVGRCSRVHLRHPPLRTAASSNPKARNIHQRRAAHMFELASYTTTRVPSPTPYRDIASANRVADGIVNGSWLWPSDRSLMRSAKPVPGMWRVAHAARPLS